jgi:hypothetical protein
MKKIAITGGVSAFSIKNMRPLRTLSAVAGLLVAFAQHGMAAESNAIGLGKPVAASLRPDIFYWPFDDGIVGESEPSTVADLSGNGFDGRIINGRKDGNKLIYGEGKFGTGVYAQGFDSNVSWKETSRFNAASDPSKLILKNQPFTGGVWFKMDDLRPAGHAPIRVMGALNGKPVSLWRLGVTQARLSKGQPSDDQDLPAQPEGSSWNLSFEVGGAIKGKSTAATEVFADRKWHHIGFSVSLAQDQSSAGAEREFTVIYWLDGEMFETVTFAAAPPEFEPGSLSLVMGWRVWGMMDDAFLTSGVFGFKK